MIEHTPDRNERFRYVIYARLSTDEPNARTLDKQHEIIKQYLRTRFGKLVRFSKVCESGTDGRRRHYRTVLQHLRRDIRAGKVTWDVVTYATWARDSRTR